MDDIRIEQAKKIIEAMVTKSLYEYTDVLLKKDKVIAVVNKTLLLEIQLKGVVEEYPDVGFKFVPGDIPITPDNFIANIIDDYSQKYDYIRSYKPIVARDDCLRDNDEFEKLLSLKSEQGMKYYKMPGINLHETYCVPMFSGFINASKQDKIGITIYDIQDGFLLLEINEFKKKINRDVKIYCRIIKI